MRDWVLRCLMIRILVVLRLHIDIPFSGFPSVLPRVISFVSSGC